MSINQKISKVLLVSFCSFLSISFSIHAEANKKSDKAAAPSVEDFAAIAEGSVPKVGESAPEVERRSKKERRAIKKSEMEKKADSYLEIYFTTGLVSVVLASIAGGPDGINFLLKFYSFGLIGGVTGVSVVEFGKQIRNNAGIVMATARSLNLARYVVKKALLSPFTLFKKLVGVLNKRNPSNAIFARRVSDKKQKAKTQKPEASKVGTSSVVQKVLVVNLVDALKRVNFEKSKAAAPPAPVAPNRSLIVREVTSDPLSKTGTKKSCKDNF